MDGGTNNTDGSDGYIAVYYQNSITIDTVDYALNVITNVTVTPEPTVVVVPTIDPATAVWHSRTYNYSNGHPNRITDTTDGDAYTYDANGNQVSRLVDGVTQTLVYNAENRLSGVSDDNGNSESYLYDGDGVRVGRVRAGEATYLFMGGMYEVSVEIPTGTVTDTKSYYTVAGQVIAVRDTDGLSTLLTDHLGSILGEVDGLGTLVGEQRYLPFGELRTDLMSITSTDLSFTGQRSLIGTGLIDYHARQYDPALRTFIQPDPIIPDAYNVQDRVRDRYAYVHGNPVRFTDPSGNRPCGDGEAVDCNGIKTPSQMVNAALPGFNIDFVGDWTDDQKDTVLEAAEILSIKLLDSSSSKEPVYDFFNSLIGTVTIVLSPNAEAGCITYYLGNGNSNITCGHGTVISAGTIIHEFIHVLDKRYQELSTIDDKANPNEYPYNACENCFASDYLPLPYWSAKEYTLYAFACPTIQCIAHPPSLPGYDSREAFANIGQVWVLGGSLFESSAEGTELKEWISYFLPEFIGRMGY